MKQTKDNSRNSCSDTGYCKYERCYRYLNLSIRILSVAVILQTIALCIHFILT